MASIKPIIRKDAVLHDGKTRIYLQIIINRKVKTRVTDYLIYPKNWNAKRGEVSKNEPLATAINISLKTVITRLQKRIYDLAEKNEPLTHEKLFTLVKFSNTQGFKDYATKIIAERPVSDKRKSDLLNCVDKFELYRPKLTMQDFNAETIDGFKAWLHKQDYASNTITAIMIRLKSIINVALRDGVLQHDPYNGVSIAAYKSRKDFLSFGELQLLLNELPTLAPEPHEAIRRFCFCCCTGLRFGDADKLDYTMLRQTDKGFYFVFEQNKTNDTVLVPLNNIAVKLVDTSQKSGLVFKPVTNQHLNRYTKKICSKLGITRNITTHVARHTFVTVSQELGMDRNMAGAIAGHKNPKTTAGYSHYNLNSLFDAIAKWN